MNYSRNDRLPVTEWEDYLNWHPAAEKEEFPEQYVRCPRCKGTGLDRWEEDDCDECLGEGSIADLLPNVKRIR